jgi:hypothetical protein
VQTYSSLNISTPLSLSRFPFALIPFISSHIAVHSFSLTLLHPIFFPPHFFLLLLYILPSFFVSPLSSCSLPFTLLPFYFFTHLHPFVVPTPLFPLLVPFHFTLLYIYIFPPILRSLFPLFLLPTLLRGGLGWRSG